MIFDIRDKSKLSPILPYEESTDGASRKKLTVPSVVPQILSSPMHSSLSQPSGKGQIQEIIESSPKQDLLDLQPSQEPTSCQGTTVWITDQLRDQL